MWTKIKDFLLSHVLFIGLMGLLTGVIIGLLIYTQFSSIKRIPKEDLMEVEWYRPAPKMPVQLYYHGFDVVEMRLVVQAAQEWRNATDGTINVLLEPLEPPQPFSESFYKDYEKKTLWHLDPNDKETALLFAKYSIKTDGFAVGNFVAIVRDKSLDDQQFLRMMAHEFGHICGLEHIRAGYPALMNLKAKDAITMYDLMQVEYVYGVRLLR